MHYCVTQTGKWQEPVKKGWLLGIKGPGSWESPVSTLGPSPHPGQHVWKFCLAFTWENFTLTSYCTTMTSCQWIFRSEISISNIWGGKGLHISVSQFLASCCQCGNDWELVIPFFICVLLFFFISYLSRSFQVWLGPWLGPGYDVTYLWRKEFRATKGTLKWNQEVFI